MFELGEAIIRLEEASYNYYEAYDDKEKEELKQHIAEEIADVLVMLKQFQYYYDIEDKEIEEVMKYKIERQLKRIEDENKQ